MRPVLYALIFAGLFFSCKKEEIIIPPNNCPECRAEIYLNDQVWPSYAVHSFLDPRSNKAFFDISVYPADRPRDVLYLSRLPLQSGIFQLDSIHEPHVSLFVLPQSGWCGTADDYYTTAKGEDNFLEILAADSTTNYFKVSFAFTLYPNGDRDAIAYTRHYSSKLKISGTAEGFIKD